MPLTWVEDKASREATIVRPGTRGRATYTKSFKIFGSDDDQVVHAEVSQTIMQSLYYWQYPYGNVQCTVETYTLSYIGDKAWQLTINYEKQGSDPGGGDEQDNEPVHRARSFDTSGGTQHITQGLSETKYGPGPDQQKAIGVDDTTVNGVDIVIPALQWSETYDVPSAYVTASYVRGVSYLTGTTNDSTFRTFAAGEVLFMGCSGTQEWDSDKGDGPWSLSYKFVASPNAGTTLPALTVGTIAGINKKGHEYMWVRYERDVDGGSLITKPKCVYVNRVYREGDFSQLGIGT